jgi:hypothetical protein
MQMFWTFKLSFAVDILAILAWQQFWLLFKKGNIFQSSGHSVSGLKGLKRNCSIFQ